MTNSACYFKGSERRFPHRLMSTVRLDWGRIGDWAPAVTVSGVNSAVEEQRVKLRFTGASCQSEEPWSTVAMVTSRRRRRVPAGWCRWMSQEITANCVTCRPSGSLGGLWMSCSCAFYTSWRSFLQWVHSLTPEHTCSGIYWDSLWRSSPA